MFPTRNMLIYFAGKMVPALSSLLVMYLGLRYLGKSEFGKYNLIMNSALIVSTFMVGWIQQSMLRFSSGNTINDPSMKTGFDKLTVTSSLISFVIMLLAAAIYFHLSLLQCLTVSGFTFTFCIFSIELTQLQSQFKATKYVIIESAYYFIVIIASLLMIYSIDDLNFNIYFIAMLLAGIVIILVNPSHSIFSFFKFSSAEDRNFFKKTFTYGFPITLWLFISGLFNVADRFVIREFFGYQSLGVYSSVYDFIYKICGFACLPVVLTMHPAIVKAWNDQDKTHARQLIRRALVLEFIILIFAVVGFALLNNFIFNSVLNLNEQDLYQLVFPLVLSAMLWQMSLFLHKPLELLFLQKQMVIGILLSIISNLAANLLLVPRYGYRIAAITTLGSTVVYVMYVLLVIFYNSRKIK
jgi:O-antigen/teichoic acid export membrane protein